MINSWGPERRRRWPPEWLVAGGNLGHLSGVAKQKQKENIVWMTTGIFVGIEITDEWFVANEEQSHGPWSRKTVAMTIV